MILEILPSTIRHAKEVSEDLREKDKIEARAIGIDPVKGTFHAYRSALWKRTAVIDGRAVALWGVAGNPLGLVGQPYLITANGVEKVSPLKFARIYISELQHMKLLFPILENYVDASYDGAVRLLRLAGFELTGPFPMEPSLSEFYKFRIES